MPTSFTQWFNAFKKYWVASLFAFASVMAIAVLVILFAPRKYQSQARLMLRVGRESISVDPTASTSTLSLHQTREHEIQSALGVMNSREILDKVIEEVGVKVVLAGSAELEEESEGEEEAPGFLSRMKSKLMAIDPVPEEEVAKRKLIKGISIYAPQDSSVVSVSYKTGSAEVAQAVVDAWLNSYITEHARVSRNQGTFDFFQKQGKELEQQLKAARDSLQKAKSEYEIVTVPGAQLMLENQMTSVRQKLLEVGSEIAAAESRIIAFKDILDNSIDATITAETSGKTNEARDQMRSQLFELEVLEKDFRSKLTDDHPKLLAVQRQLADAREILSEQTSDRKEVTRSVNPAHQKMSELQMIDMANRKGLEDKRDQLNEKKDEVLAEMKALNAHEGTIAGLIKNVEILESRFTEHAEKMEQARLGQVLENEKITSVSIVQPASFEQLPVTPNKQMCAVIGFMAACAAALSLPILLELRGLAKVAKRRSETHDWKFDEATATTTRTDRPVSDTGEMKPTSVSD
ncbi:MAG: GumC family protein [Rubripirellula sp.]